MAAKYAKIVVHLDRIYKKKHDPISKSLYMDWRESRLMRFKLVRKNIFNAFSR